MNKNLNLVRILKDCPKGTKFYSILHGEVEYEGISENDSYEVKFRDIDGDIEGVKPDGRYLSCLNGECILFPSKDQRDWSKFTATWYKAEKFDPKTLKPFDRVLVRHSYAWRCELLSHYIEYKGKIDFYCTHVDYVYSYCIPYNEDTKHLVGKTDEAPEYYRYWED